MAPAWSGSPRALRYSVRVLGGSGSGCWSWVICGIDWVTQNAVRLNIEVANMSLGGSGSDDGNCGKTNSDALHKAICASAGAGVTYVVAAGNSNTDFAGQVPAAYNEVLTVTALADFNGKPGGGAAATCRSDVDDTAADFNNYAVGSSDQGHTIAAPGVCIRSIWKSGKYNDFRHQHGLPPCGRHGGAVSRQRQMQRHSGAGHGDTARRRAEAASQLRLYK
jgi:subtilisin